MLVNRLVNWFVAQHIKLLQSDPTCPKHEGVPMIDSTSAYHSMDGEQSADFKQIGSEITKHNKIPSVSWNSFWKSQFLVGNSQGSCKWSVFQSYVSWLESIWATATNHSTDIAWGRCNLFVIIPFFGQQMLHDTIQNDPNCPEPVRYTISIPTV